MRRWNAVLYSMAVASALVVPSAATAEGPDQAVLNANGQRAASDLDSDDQQVSGYYAAPNRPAPAPPKKPPVQPWKGLFFDNDFSYMSDPCHEPLLGEEFKNVSLIDNDLIFSFGGEFRHRYMNEFNRLRPGGAARNTYNLWRWRNYLDVQAGDWGRAYVEFIDASAWGFDLPKLPIDENRWDILNAFLDFNLDGALELPGTLRLGRQELLYGKQRLISPLDWSNTRRNFQGAKYFFSSGDWDVHSFVTNPVNTIARRNVPVTDFDNQRDQPDYDQTFSGIYGTYRGLENSTIETYWLWLDNKNPIVGRADGSRHTIGLHWASTHPVQDYCTCEVARVWDFDVEGAYQFGKDNGQDVSAGFFTTIVGHTWKNTRWQPRLSGLFYWGSGDGDPNDNENNTFDVLYPLGHAYWGIIDNLSGQNLLDYSLQLDFSPAKKFKGIVAWHWFDLATQSDVLYNVAGVPLGTPNTGTDIGNELDLIGTYTFNPNFSVQVGYSWFWYGTYVDNNLARDDATQFYVQTQLRY